VSTLVCDSRTNDIFTTSSPTFSLVCTTNWCTREARSPVAS
jgi:hypothetical protein